MWQLNQFGAYCFARLMVKQESMARARAAHKSISTASDLSEFVGSMDRESFQQFSNVVSGQFFAPKLAALFVKPIVSATVEQIWREKMSEKPHFIRLLR